MKLSKALEILTLNINEAGKKMPPDTLEALKTATACITYCINVRRYPSNADNISIPGDAD